MVSNKSYVTINIGSSDEAKSLLRFCEELKLELKSRPMDMTSIKTNNGIKLFGLSEKSFEDRTTGRAINLEDNHI